MDVAVGFLCRGHWKIFCVSLEEFKLVCYTEYLKTKVQIRI